MEIVTLKLRFNTNFIDTIQWGLLLILEKKILNKLFKCSNKYLKSLLEFLNVFMKSLLFSRNIRFPNYCNDDFLNKFKNYLSAIKWKSLISILKGFISKLLLNFFFIVTI